MMINTDHPRTPNAYSNAVGQRKLNAALAADPDLRYRIDNALSGWRAEQQQGGGSILMDDGNPPTRPMANTVRCVIQDTEHDALEDERSNDNRTQDNLVDRKTITKTITKTAWHAAGRWTYTST